MTSKRFFQLAYIYVKANLRVEVSSYYLNYVWWVLEPVFMMTVFYVVFDIMLNQGTQHFVGFLLVGLASWNWFARSVNNSKNSIHDARGLILQVRIPKMFFPFTTVCQDSFKQLFVVALLLLFLLFYPTPVTVCWFALPILLALQFVLNLAVGMFCAAIVPFVPDMRFIVSTVIEILFFATGIFYDLDTMVLPEHRPIIYANPMAGLLKNYRAVLLHGDWPNWFYLLYVAGFSFVFLAVALYLLNRFDNVYPRVCQQ
ncbi:ABC transporter permease [Desulfovibrio sp. JC022]|uniref:ABC transporter permease n=1 Tax=Desulfovibrio sp. JC022 TaxID=2593642 RepID=UPI0013CF764E|nr:ABC transporter permease [Desulfovibrio sp. JC022]NDV24914.1 ABC transporter [Desulfovibrio sp. JC022]